MSQGSEDSVDIHDKKSEGVQVPKHRQNWTMRGCCFNYFSSKNVPILCFYPPSLNGLYSFCWNVKNSVTSEAGLWDIWKEKMIQLNNHYYDRTSEFETWALSSRSKSYYNPWKWKQVNSHRLEEEDIYILVLLSDYIIWLQYSQNYFALEATWLFMATNSEHMA